MLKLRLRLRLRLLCNDKLRQRLHTPGASAEALLHACMTEPAKEHRVCWVTR